MLIFQRRSHRHLSLCGVRCNIGTDDIFYPTLVTAALKITWTVVAFASALQLFIQAGCSITTPSIPPILAISVIGFLIIHFIGIVNTIIVIVISHTGSLKNVVPRRKLEIFAYASWIIYFVEVIWNIYSTYAIFSPPVGEEQLQNCTSYSTGLIVYKVVVLSYWGLVVFLTTMFVFLLDPLNCCLLGARIHDIEEAIDEWEQERANGNERTHRVGLHGNPFSCVIWCRGCGKGGERALNSRKNALSDVVHLFRVLFDGMETEYTFLDILAGFKLQLSYQNEMRSSGRDPTDLIQKKTVEILSRGSEYSTPNGPKELLPNELHQYTIDLKYYLKYAMAAYGWPIHVYLNPVRGPVSLCVSASCMCCCAQCQEPQFEGNQCFPHQAAIKAMTGTEVEDIITASFVNLIHIVPFYVVKVDTEERKELIVAVRGTLSIKDALTDASARMKEIDGGLLGVTPSFVHGGIYKASLGVYDHLMNNETFTELASKPEFRIVLTGHSLGAGVASVLAALFKDRHPEWSENLKAYCFATPAVFSYALAEKSQSFITSVVDGYDIVPRMTIRGLGHLLLSVKDFIDNTEDTKHKVLCCTDCRNSEVDPDTVHQRQMNTLRDLDVKRPGRTAVTEDTDGDHDAGQNDVMIHEADPGNKRKRTAKLKGQDFLFHLSKMFVSRGSKSNAASDSNLNEDENEDMAMMFIPGRIMHLELEEVNHLKRYCSCGLKQAGEIRASWKSREDFSGIQIHSSMLLDHGPTRTIDYVTTFCNQTEPPTTAVSYGTIE